MNVKRTREREKRKCTAVLLLSLQLPCEKKKIKNRKGIEKKREKKKSVIPSPEKFTSPSAILQTHTHEVLFVAPQSVA